MLRHAYSRPNCPIRGTYFSFLKSVSVWSVSRIGYLFFTFVSRISVPPVLIKL